MNDRIVKEAFVDELNKIAADVKADILKGIGASLAAGKTVKGAAHFMRDVFGKSRESIEKTIRAANPGASEDDIAKMVSAHIKKKNAPFNKAVDITSNVVTGAGITHAIGKPLVEKFVVGSRVAQQAKLEKKILAGVGIGVGAGVGGSIIHSKMNQQPEAVYSV